MGERRIKEEYERGRGGKVVGGITGGKKKEEKKEENEKKKKRLGKDTGGREKDERGRRGKVVARETGGMEKDNSCRNTTKREYLQADRDKYIPTQSPTRGHAITRYIYVILSCLL